MSINLKTAQSLTRHVKNASFQILLSNKRVVQGWILGLKKLEMSVKAANKDITWHCHTSCHTSWQITDEVEPHEPWIEISNVFPPDDTLTKLDIQRLHTNF
jgi:hypothetical protein